jgi:hypothetical protein
MAGLDILCLFVLFVVGRGWESEMSGIYALCSFWMLLWICPDLFTQVHAVWQYVATMVNVEVATMNAPEGVGVHVTTGQTLGPFGQQPRAPRAWRRCGM